MALSNEVAKFIADANVAHQIVHGSDTTTVMTEGGPVRSFAKLIADFGSGFLATAVNYVQTGVGAIARSVMDKFRERISVQDFMTAAQISDVRSHSITLDLSDAIEAALARVTSTSRFSCLEFPDGSYSFSRTITIPKANLAIRGGSRSGTELCYTGNSIAVQFTDAVPNNGAYSFGGSIRHLSIRGNANSTDLLRIKNVNHILVEDINLRESNSSSGVGLHILGTVCGHFKDIVCSTNAQLMTSRLQNGIIVDADPTTLTRATANRFENCIIEGTYGDKVQFIGCDGSVVTGGTFENGPGNGVTIVANSRMHTFIGVSFENTSGFADIADSGYGNKYINCYTRKLIYFGPTSKNCEVTGAYHQSIYDEGTNNIIEGLSYSFFSAGGTITPSTTTSVRRLYNVQTSAFTHFPKAPITVTVGASPYTYTNTSGLFEQVLYMAGTVTQVSVGRSGSAVGNIPTGGGAVLLGPTDSLTFTYTVAPTVKRMPFGSNYS